MGRNGLAVLRRRRRFVSALGIALVLAAFVSPIPAIAAEPHSRTTSTFQLDPDQGVVHVTIVLTVSNDRANSTRTYPCTNYYIYPDGSREPFQDTCTETTFYYNDRLDAVVDPNGTNFAATTTDGAAHVSVKSGGEGFLSVATVTFPRVLVGGSRSTTLTYDLPGGAPRSAAVTRAGRAYARFCAFPGGAYLGAPESFTIVIPSRFAVTQYAGETLSRSATDDQISLVMAASPRPEGNVWRGGCVEAIDDTAFATATYASSSGVDLTLKGWPEDAEWLSTVGGTVGGAIDDLEALIGVPPRTTSIEIHEVVAEALGGYAGDADAIGNIRLSEAALDPTVAAHELAHAWFNRAFTHERWLLEGYAEWAAREVAAIDSCTQVSGSSAAPLNIDTWKYLPPVPTAADSAAVLAEYAAACSVVTDVAHRVGNDGMRAIYKAFVGSEIPYVNGDAAEVLPERALGWRRWLDVVDERALVGRYDDLDWLQNELESVGATARAAELEDRSRARQAYHHLLGETGPWRPPLAIRDPMTAWSFPAATKAMDAASEVHALRLEAAGLVAGLADSDAIQMLYEGSTTQSDLDAALDAAEAERDAAREVAAALVAATAERSFVQTIGLLGSDLAADTTEAVSVLVGTDYGAAKAAAQQVVLAVANAESAGAVRLLVAIGLILLVVVALFVIRRRIVGKRRPPLGSAIPDWDASEVSR